jgi:hypothetical protein
MHRSFQKWCLAEWREKEAALGRTAKGSRFDLGLTGLRHVLVLVLCRQMLR